jgi:hypothetical protein
VTVTVAAEAATEAAEQEDDENDRMMMRISPSDMTDLLSLAPSAPASFCADLVLAFRS